MTENLTRTDDDPDGQKKVMPAHQHSMLPTRFDLKICLVFGGLQRQRLKSVYQKAGFLSMGEGQFDKTLPYFIKGALDPRILICLFEATCASKACSTSFLMTSCKYIAIKERPRFEEKGKRCLQAGYISLQSGGHGHGLSLG